MRIPVSGGSPTQAQIEKAKTDAALGYLGTLPASTTLFGGGGAVPTPDTTQTSGGGSTYDTPIPGVALYGQAALAAKQAYQNALARLNQKRSSTLRQYGYKAEIDPETGVLRNMAVDPANQFGYYQQLLKSGADAATSAEDMALARGLGGEGGLAAQGQTAAKHEFGKNSAALGDSLMGTLADFQDQQDSAAYQRNQALYMAEMESARSAIDNGQFNPGDYTGLSAESPAPTETPASILQLLSPPAPSGSSGVEWGGKTFTKKSALAKWLTDHGTDYTAWARNHPSAAQKLK